MTEIQAKDLLNTIARSVNTCKKCRLNKWRTHSVPGSGSHHSSIVFVGEAPGYHEDRQGLPFVGRAGELLNRLLKENGIGREEVWIGNVIKCRPPENRDPMVDEIRACTPYLGKQIETINPKVIITLGRFAMGHFVKTGSISENHGKVFKVAGRLILPLYHPAAALRDPNVLAVLTKDFKMIKKVLKGEATIEAAVRKEAENENQLGLI